MKSYQDMLHHIMDKGVRTPNRTGIDTISVFGYQFRHDLSSGFPLLTTKKVHFKSVAIELLWLISGSTNIKFMKDNGVSIWDEWADENGELGPVYGKQWRKWNRYECYDASDDCSSEYYKDEPLDQLADVIERIKKNPNDRRLIVTAWNPPDVPKQKLPPCHCFYQFSVKEGALSCHMYQRSADAFLGVPFNIASYALLTQMVAHVTRLKLGDLIISFGDLHLYVNHLEQVELQLSRKPYRHPTVFLNRDVKNIDDFTFNNIVLADYTHHPAIKAEVAV